MEQQLQSRLSLEQRKQQLQQLNADLDDEIEQDQASLAPLQVSSL